MSSGIRCSTLAVIALMVWLAALGAAAQQVRPATGPDAVVQQTGRSDPSFTQPSVAPGVDYTVPTEDEIRQVLDRIRQYFVRATPYRVVDTATKRTITDFTTPIKTAGIDTTGGEFNDWTYSMGVVMAAMLQAAEVTGDSRFRDYPIRNFDFIFDHLDYFKRQAAEFGPQPRGYRRYIDMKELDDCGAIGAALVKLYAIKKDERYKAGIDLTAAHIATRQLRLADGTLARPRPQKVSVWIDDAYMSIPFLAQMGKLTGDRKYFDDAAKQVIGMTNILFDRTLGLYDHSWFQNSAFDAKFFWGRGAGWMLMAMGELLSVLPEDHPDRPQVLETFRRAVQGVAAVQGGSGLWHNLLDKPDSYLETSASAMFTFAVARGVNRGWLAPVYAPVAQAGWKAVARRVHADGRIEGICVGTTAAYDAVYYYHRPTDLGAMQGYGPTIMAGAEVITMLRTFDIDRTLNTFHYRARAK